jgi:hypothetical protein
VTYADGDNEINIIDVRSHNMRKRIRPGIGAVSTLAWSRTDDDRVLRQKGG